MGDAAGADWGAVPVPRWADADATAGRQPRARATRRAIMLAAARLIDDHGYHGASLNDVAAAAGTTKGALYFHFASKAAVAEALLDEAVASWNGLFDRVDALEHDPLRKLLVCYDAYAGGLTHDGISRAALRVARDAGVTWPAEAGPNWPRSVAGLAQRAHVAGLFRSGIDPGHLSRHLFATATGHFHLADSFAAGPTMWARMNDTWIVLLPAVATTAWVATWESSGWWERCAPDPAAYARADLLGG